MKWAIIRESAGELFIGLSELDGCVCVCKSDRCQSGKELRLFYRCFITKGWGGKEMFLYS